MGSEFLRQFRKRRVDKTLGASRASNMAPGGFLCGDGRTSHRRRRQRIPVRSRGWGCELICNLIEVISHCWPVKLGRVILERCRISTVIQLVEDQNWNWNRFLINYWSGYCFVSGSCRQHNDSKIPADVIVQVSTRLRLSHFSALFY